MLIDGSVWTGRNTASIPGELPMTLRFLIALALSMLASGSLHADALSTDLDQARKLLEDGKTKQATQALEKTVERFPDRVEAWALHSQANCRMAQEANILTQLSWAGECRMGLERFQQLAPDSPNANSGLLQFYLQAPGIAGGGRDKADALVSRMQQQSPGLGHYGRYVLASVDKRDAETLGEMEAAVLADPAQPLYRITLAILYISNANWDPARNQLQALVQLDPEHPMAHYQLGRIAALTGEQIDEGISYLDRFLALPKRPQDFDGGAWWRKGQLLEKRQEREAALSAFSRAVALNPELEEARQDLERLRKAP